MNRFLRLAICLLAALTLFPGPAMVAAAGTAAEPQPGTLPDGGGPAVVRAILFWAEGCPKCELARSEVLPAIQEQYGARLQIHEIELSKEIDLQYFLRLEAGFDVPPAQRGVPALIAGDVLLAGPVLIAQQLPQILDDGLAAGGLSYPRLPGIEPYLPAEWLQETGSQSDHPTLLALRVAKENDAMTLNALESLSDGFALAYAVMAGMILALAYVIWAAARHGRSGLAPRAADWTWRLIPWLLVAGLVVAGYLAYVETQDVAPVCGPVGDCSTVQSSPYARLLGILPVGVLGVLGYLGMLLAWLASRFAGGQLRRMAPLALFGMALFGVLYALYLTYLEPFVIRAVCAWCLSNAVIITLVMLLAVGPALDVLSEDSD